jgi:glutamine amidotransferase
MFGCICNEPRRLTEALAPVRSVLVAPGSHKGWGMGYVQGGEVLLKRHPRAAENLDFFDALGAVASDYVLAHAGGDPELPGTDNTQPFRFRRWLFAQTGSMATFADIKPALAEHIPDFMRRNIRGKTSAEHVFHVFLAFLHDAGALDDPNVSPNVVRRALRDAVAMVLSLITKAGGDRGPGNILVTNSRSMLAVRLGQPMCVRRFNTRATRDRKEFRAVLVVSELDQEGEGFESLPDRAVLTISRELQADIVDLEA